MFLPVLRCRFIPAFAGNTLFVIVRIAFCAVHPRVCGEHMIHGNMDPTKFGSSPRLRGTLLISSNAGSLRRFIPAFAGNTRTPAKSAASMAVHPRVCGEHEALRNGSPDIYGSSPRLRGTHTPRFRSRSASRFIPAFAGNTKHLQVSNSPAPVHPRVCGEHSCAPPRPSAARGSSPRLRGTHVHHVQHPERDRFIPAFAGNTRRPP